MPTDSPKSWPLPGEFWVGNGAGNDTRILQTTYTCDNCGMIQSHHIIAKCLFQPTYWKDPSLAGVYDYSSLAYVRFEVWDTFSPPPSKRRIILDDHVSAFTQTYRFSAQRLPR